MVAMISGSLVAFHFKRIHRIFFVAVSYILHTHKHSLSPSARWAFYVKDVLYYHLNSKREFLSHDIRHPISMAIWHLHCLLKNNRIFFNYKLTDCIRWESIRKHSSHCFLHRTMTYIQMINNKCLHTKLCIQINEC